MKNFTLPVLLATLIFANACSSNKSDPAPTPTPTPTTHTVQIRSTYSDMKYQSDGVTYREGFLRVKAVDGSKTTYSNFGLPTGASNPGSGTTSNDIVGFSNTFSTGTKMTLTVSLNYEKDKSGIRPITGSRPTFIYADIYVDGNKKETVKLDSNTPFTPDGRTDVFAESTITL